MVGARRRLVLVVGLAFGCELGDSAVDESLQADTLAVDGTGTEPGDDDDATGTGGPFGDDASGADTTFGDEPYGTTGGPGMEPQCPRAEVAVNAGHDLNVRPDPSTANPPIGALPDGTIVDVLGEEVGQNIDGNDVWYLIATPQLQGYVLSTYALCTLEEPPVIDEDGWYLPLACGTSATVSQGNFGTTSHSGTSAYAFDFSLPLGTPLVAIASGTVTHVYDGTQPGDPCYDGGGPECFEYANYVTMRHADGTKSTYRHLQAAMVGVGDVVGLGQVVGLSGSTGYSTGPHAHVMRMQDCGEAHCQSIEVVFSDVAGDGIPDTGDTVMSGNCPSFWTSHRRR